MKKMIIAAAIVCAAVVSQAAQVRWIDSNVKDITGAAAYSGAATLYVTAVEGGAVQTYDATMNAGMINLLVGDASAGDAGFLKQGKTYNMYYTMTDANGNIYTSTTKSNIAVMFPQQSPVAFGGVGSWAAVPEPTSGLLLLLGVAGLALRRRRA